MKILLTGVNGFIGRALLPKLLGMGHEVYGCVRNKKKAPIHYLDHPNFHVVEVDFLKTDMPRSLPKMDAAYYLIHSLGKSLTHVEADEAKQAHHFSRYVESLEIKQVIYLSGISYEEELSSHLFSRKNVGDILQKGDFSLTILCAAIIIGKGSASFQIMVDLVHKMPIMVAPESLNNDCQPIALPNVLQYLIGVLGLEAAFDRQFDIGGPDILSYKDMLYRIAWVCGKKRKIITVPWISPQFEAHWFYFITSASYRIAVNLANSMRNRVTCREEDIQSLVPQKLLYFEEAVAIALQE